MPFNTVECPMCFKNFSTDFIELHAQKCKGDASNCGLIDQDEVPLTKKPRPADCKNPFFSPKAKKGPDMQKRKQPVHGSNSGLPSSNKQLLVQPTSLKTSWKLDKAKHQPLAERSRPSAYDDYIGQEKVLGKNSMLNTLLQRGMIPSMILWGPPGCGKTSLAHVIATQSKNNPNSSTRFVKLSATNSGKADIQTAVDVAKNERRMFQRSTILFIDEIHRFNKLQQDSFLPHVENGTIILIGATTENPSFSLNSALLSRCRVIILEKLSSDDVKKILVRAIEKFEDEVFIKWKNDFTSSAKTSSDEPTESNLGLASITISEEALDFLAGVCDGDARTALNGLQMAIQVARSSQDSDGFEIDIDCVEKSLHRSHVLYDRTGDQHYEMISAFQKSIRGSDDNATLYWLARMLEGGEDPRYIARRMIRIASEDIGVADSSALNLAVSTQQACQFIGMPECDVVLAHCAVYLARAPKSPEVYLALRKVFGEIRNRVGPQPGVPLHLRNASTKLMKDLGYGKGYQHNPPANVNQTYMPESMLDSNFFIS